MNSHECKMKWQANKFWNVIAHFVYMCVCVCEFLSYNYERSYILESYCYCLPKFVETILCGDTEGPSDVIQIDSLL